MSAKIETSIWLAIKSRIDALPLPYEKVWPGSAFEVTSIAPYLRIGRVTVAPVRRLIADGKPHERTGVLMVTLVYPLGQNVSVYDQVAATIAEHFKDGTKMSYGSVCVTVRSYPHVGDGYEENGWWTVPVRIPWRCFA